VPTRRTFLKAGGCALVAYAAAPRFLLRDGRAAEANGRCWWPCSSVAPWTGFSMVMPYGRGRLCRRASVDRAPAAEAWRDDRAIDLDGFFALHPALAPLVPLWEKPGLRGDPRVRLLRTRRARISTPRTTWRPGRRGSRATPDGWLARAVKTRPSNQTPFRAVAMGRRSRGRSRVTWAQSRCSPSSASTSRRRGRERAAGIRVALRARDP